MESPILKMMFDGIVLGIFGLMMICDAAVYMRDYCLEAWTRKARSSFCV
jgi:hypothetical protein